MLPLSNLLADGTLQTLILAVWEMRHLRTQNTHTHTHMVFDTFKCYDYLALVVH